jgi:hypothetical protein
MPKINENLDEEAHKIITEFKKKGKYSNLGDALNAFIKQREISGE